MLNSKIYKKYYPLKNVADIFHMAQEDRAVLVKWLHRIKTDIELYNFLSYKKALKNGFKNYARICISYDRDILSLAEKVSKIGVYSCEIDEKDITFLNGVIYRHKYIEIISTFCFPVNRQ